MGMRDGGMMPRGVGRRRSRLLARLALVGAAVTVASCFSWIGRFGDPFDAQGRASYFDLIVQDAVDKTRVVVDKVPRGATPFEQSPDKQLQLIDPVVSRSGAFEGRCLSPAASEPRMS